ncbi:MAG: hypothetical protein Q4D16_21610 [Eubacteriales bacterium]|nr:hypothetical protein [Eubacteriales bacterium]
MDRKKWNQEYPKMPEAFHLALEETVKQNIEKDLYTQGTERTRRKPYRKRWYLLGIAVVLLLGSFTATAKKEFNFAEYLSLDDSQNIPEIFQSDINAIVEKEPTLPEFIDKEWVKTWEKREDDSPLLDIREVMYDGGQLCIYGVPTKAGKRYQLYTHRLIINGQTLSQPIDTWDDEGSGDNYVFTADIHNLGLECPFEVTLPLSVFINGEKRSENQDFTFTVETEAEVTALPEQEFIFDDYTVKVTDLKKSVTSFWGKVVVERTREQQEAYEKEEYRILSPVFKEKDGTFLHSMPFSYYDGDVDENKDNQWEFWEKLSSADEKSVMLYLELILKEQPELSSVEEVLHAGEREYLREGIEISLES